MKKNSKKELRSTIEVALNQMLAQFEISSPSKKTVKLVEETSKKFSLRILEEVKKHSKKIDKVVKATKKAKPVKKAKSKIDKTPAA